MSPGEEWIGGMIFMITLIFVAMGIAKITKSKDYKVFGYLFSFIMVAGISYAFYSIGGKWVALILMVIYFYFIWTIQPAPQDEEKTNVLLKDK